MVERIFFSLPERFSGLRIDCYVLMSTHLYVIFACYGIKEGLPERVRTFKALVARSTGTRFWQPNYYEHVIRTEAALFKIREYTENNPLAVLGDPRAEIALNILDFLKGLYYAPVIKTRCPPALRARGLA